MESKQFLVSILVAAHNEELYIGRCIRSLLNQSLPKQQFEIIVVNDASGDRTPYALQLFGGDIRTIHNEEKLGLPASLNRAISASRGKYVVRLDGDDYVSREYLNVLSLYLELNPDFHAVACDYLRVDDQENVLDRKNCMEDPIGCGIMFRKESLLDVGGYDEAFHYHEDKELRVRFLKKYQISRVALPLYRYRQHEGNMTKNTEAVEKYFDQLTKKHGEIYV